jgi:hypothetical protein
MPGDQQDAWILRVLGVPVDVLIATHRKVRRIRVRGQARRPGQVRYASTYCVKLWDSAVEAAIADTGLLADVLEETGDPSLKAIANACVTAVRSRLGSEIVPMLCALDRAPPEGQDAARSAAREVIRQFKERIGAEPLISLLEANPQGVQVSARQSLVGALDRIDRELSTQPATSAGASG